MPYLESFQINNLHTATAATTHRLEADRAIPRLLTVRPVRLACVTTVHGNTRIPGVHT